VHPPDRSRPRAPVSALDRRAALAVWPLVSRPGVGRHLVGGR
jgi:hypothetical protein